MSTQFLPGTAIARRMVKDGKQYWVSGYQVFDPEYPVSLRKGFSPISLKKGRQKEVWTYHVLIQRSPTAKPFKAKKSDIKLLTPKLKTVTFDQLFGSVRGAALGERVLSGFEIDEQDDLALIGDTQSTDDNESDEDEW